MRRLALATMAAGLLFCGKSTAQSPEMLEDVGNLLNDALYFSDKYMTPATDAAIYQSSSAWVVTPKKSKLWDVKLGLHINTFFVPSENRRFTINNSDFSFFAIEGGATSASVPTALGNDDQIWLVGYIDNEDSQEEVRLKTPEGVDMEQIVYPYLQGSVGLPFGTDLIVKYSTRVALKKGHYQVYGAGLKHNLSQYCPSLEAKNYFFSIMGGYSREEISFNFLDIQTTFGTLGLNEIAGKVGTLQFQVNGSKQWGKFELMGGVITNFSHVEYEVGGKKGTIEDIIPFQSLVNRKLEEIYKDKTNVIGEVSGRYQLGKFYIQPVVAFGKFVNTNFSVQYEF